MFLKLLKQFESLFNGTLSKWKTKLVKIETRSDSKPVNSRWYPVPRINKLTFKKELEKLVSIGVLERVQEFE